MNYILLVDDDVELCEMLSEYLSRENFTVDMAHDGEQALKKEQQSQYDLIVLDVMMPKLNGFDVLRELRNHSSVPVLMLTARGDDVDSIIGLELGADDYLAKPCNPRVLVARIRAILRRAELPEANAAGIDKADVIQIDDVTLQTGSRDVFCNDEPVIMTSTEYSVLEVLIREAGHVVAKADLYQRALGREIARYDRSLDMHISNLRKKLGTLPDGKERIVTVRGVGYLYVSQ
ncbi:MAG: response regulator [Gammaproteobacteria bacterium]|nr:response regulator [Gammaproteobacteria bacterium]